MSIWTLRKNSVDSKKMAEDIGISEIFAQVLGNRKIFSKDSAMLYIKPSISLMNNPFLMKDIKKAIDLIIFAKKNKKKIFIYGDYDVDGVCSTVILYKAFKKFGCDTEYYIPDRKSEGYGLNMKAIKTIKDKGCNIIFSCDNGIASINEALYIKELDMRFIILDHHEPKFSITDNKDIIPQADAVIDSKQKDCPYPFKSLCAAGMAYKFVKALFQYSHLEIENEAELFVFAAIATVCDIVDLADENRIFVKNGLRILNSGRKINIGIQALFQCQGFKKKITEETLGFIIGPCINACGRIESALQAVELFIEEDYNKALIKAEKLVLTNEKRKKITDEAYKKAIQVIENSEIKDDKVIVLFDDTIDESVMGIVAGRIKDTYYKPVIVISKGNEFDKGSCRSIKPYNIFQNLLLHKDLLVKFGGHSAAAGISINHQNIEILRKSINKNCTLTEKELTEVIRIDKELSFSDITFKLAEELELMRPFGEANSPAIFATKNVFVKTIRFVGVNQNIIQFVFSDKNNISLKAVSFNIFDKFQNYIKNNFEPEKQKSIFYGNLQGIELNFDIVYNIDINEFNGDRNIQLILKDFRSL